MKLGLLLCLVTLGAIGRDLTPEEKRAEFQTLGALIKNQYGPYEYKLKRFDLNVDNLVEKYSGLAANTKNRDFYYLLNRFVAEFKDSHFSSRVQTDHVSTLGFICDRIEGKVVLDYINRGIARFSDFPFKRGDEIVALDGKPIAEVLKDITSYIGEGYEETANRVGAMMVGYRPGAMLPPQNGKATIEVRPLGENSTKTATLEWKQMGTDPMGEDTWGRKYLSPINYRELSIFDIAKEAPKHERSFWCSGLTRVAVPEDAVPIKVSPFVAYYHKTGKGNVGYLRIPHYSWSGETGGDESELRFKQYEYVIDQLEKNTVGLIIDQAHNCGGSVMFLENMVGLFAKEDFQGVQFQFLTNRTEQLTYKQYVQDSEILDTLEGADLLKILKLMKSATGRLTEKTTFHSDRRITPNGVRYTKPIVMLIDEMSGSGGDAFPAMLQGLGRAKLFGVRTMGAGGHVIDAGPMNYSGNSLRMTKSLFYHPNGTAIENNGVDPDVLYQPTMYDYMNDYRNYQKEYLKVLEAMIQ